MCVCVCVCVWAGLPYRGFGAGVGAVMTVMVRCLDPLGKLVRQTYGSDIRFQRPATDEGVQKPGPGTSSLRK